MKIGPKLDVFIVNSGIIGIIIAKMKSNQEIVVPI